MKENKGHTISPGNPLAIEMDNMLNSIMNASQEALLVNNGAFKHFITIRREHMHSKQWCELHQKELLTDLSARASKLFIHFNVAWEYGADKVYMTQSLSGMSKRTYPQAIEELMEKRIIHKEKRGWYWLNVVTLMRDKTREI